MCAGRGEQPDGAIGVASVAPGDTRALPNRGDGLVGSVRKHGIGEQRMELVPARHTGDDEGKTRDYSLDVRRADKAIETNEIHTEIADRLREELDYELEARHMAAPVRRRTRRARHPQLPRSRRARANLAPREAVRR